MCTRGRNFTQEFPRAPAETHGVTPHLTVALSVSQQVLETLAEDPTRQRHPVLLTDREGFLLSK